VKRLYLVLIVMLVIITGCVKEKNLAGSSDIENQVNEIIEQQNLMPQEMPEDFDFMVRFGYGEVTKNEINTYQDTVTKDLVVKGTATADIAFTMDD